MYVLILPGKSKEKKIKWKNMLRLKEKWMNREWGGAIE